MILCVQFADLEFVDHLSLCFVVIFNRLLHLIEEPFEYTRLVLNKILHLVCGLDDELVPELHAEHLMRHFFVYLFDFGAYRVLALQILHLSNDVFDDLFIL